MKSDNSIPFSRMDLIGHLAGQIGEPRERYQFVAFCGIVGKVFHFGFHEDLEAWKSLYAPLDPDRVNGLIEGISPRAAGASPTDAIDGIRKALVRANYREITKERIQEALHRYSPWGLQLKVDLDAYECLALYGRGEFQESSVKRTLFIRRTFDYSVFRHVVLVFKLKNDLHGTWRAGKESEGKYRRDKVYLKLFKNVPTVDLEMLFPDADIRIKPLDKMKVILPLAIGAASSLYKISGYILGNGSPRSLWTQIGFWALVGGLFGVALKGFFSYRTTVEKYLKSLTESLYFQNLDNNSGVFKYLVDDAEEEECKEVILAYYFLAFGSQGILGEAELDREVERHFRDVLQAETDFDVGDALRKLDVLKLLKSEGGSLKSLPLPLAIEELERTWTALACGEGSQASSAET